MSYLIVVGFDRTSGSPISESDMIQKMIQSICRETQYDLLQWLKNDFGFFDENDYKDKIEEMYLLLMDNAPHLYSSEDKTSWLKEYWIVDCLYSALKKCFPQLSQSEIIPYQQRWIEGIFNEFSVIAPHEYNPALNTKGHFSISCTQCQKVTIPYKIRVQPDDLPLPQTPNYCPECFTDSRELYYADLFKEVKVIKRPLKSQKLLKNEIQILKINSELI